MEWKQLGSRHRGNRRRWLRLRPVHLVVGLIAIAAMVLSGLTATGASLARLSHAGRYVALGDSIPYGHGLANPGKTSQGGLPPDQPPSTSAYPSIVAANLGYTLSIRRDGCTLSGDQLAVSGAPSVDNRWSGLDVDCHYHGQVPGHKAVDPDEFLAANLRANPPALVTIQAGADDVDFAGCLASLLGVPPNPFMHVENCVDQDGRGNYRVTPKVAAELASLHAGLHATIGLILQAAPNAKIVLVNYYQIIPAANATLTGDSAICRDLRFSRQGGAWRQSIRAKADFLQRQLNQTIALSTIPYAGISVADVTGTFNGHEMCTPSSWVFDGLWDAAHPTTVGQAHIAAAVLSLCATLPNNCHGR